jgi:hypothetical protein
LYFCIENADGNAARILPRAEFQYIFVWQRRHSNCVTVTTDGLYLERALVLRHLGERLGPLGDHLLDLKQGLGTQQRGRCTKTKPKPWGKDM